MNLPFSFASLGGVRGLCGWGSSTLSLAKGLWISSKVQKHGEITADENCWQRKSRIHPEPLKKPANQEKVKIKDKPPNPLSANAIRLSICYQKPLQPDNWEPAIGCLPAQMLGHRRAFAASL